MKEASPEQKALFPKLIYEPPNVTWMNNRVNKKNGCNNCIYLGDPGSGKSYAMLSTACLINPDFELEGNFYFKAGQMMREIRDYYKQNNPKKGKLWLMDELGIDGNNLKFMDAVNKGLNAFFQTSRHRRYHFLGTLPFMSMLSKGVRKLMTSVGDTNGWDKTTQLTNVAFRAMEYNDAYDKFYKKRIYVIGNEGLKPCNELRLPAPPKKILKEYESMKKEFTGDLFGEIADEIDAFEEKKMAKRYGKEATPKQKEVAELLERGRTPAEIAVIKGIALNTVYVDMRLLKKKGWKFEKEKDEITGKLLQYRVIAPEI